MCKIKSRKSCFLFNNLSNNISKIFKHLFFNSFDRLTTTSKTTLRKTTTRKEVQTYYENVPKRSENNAKRVEQHSNTCRQLYVFGWAHCFGLLSYFRIDMEFDTLILHVSVVPGLQVLALEISTITLLIKWSTQN